MGGLLTEPLSNEGAAVDVSMGGMAATEEVLLRNGMEVPQRQFVRAIIDTGARHTFFDPSVFRKLGISPYRIMPISTPSTDVPQNVKTYLVSVRLLHVSGGLHFPAMEVYESAQACFVGESDEHGVINGLLGCDFLAHCIFTYDGKHGQFILAF